LLLRVSYELDRAQRQVARVRNEQAPLPTQPAPTGPSAPSPTPLPASRRPATASRGTSRLQQRVEPTLGRIA
ncbi:MAG TPA: cell division protein FtsW, partial [Lysobacter sp.]